MSDALIPVRKAEIAIGKPLPWAVYDASGVLLLNKGVEVTSEFQLQTLMEKGLYRVRGEVADLRGREMAAQEDASSPELENGSLVAFDRILLTPGDLVQLKPMQEGAQERYNVRYLGMMKGKSLLVSTPVVDDKVLFVREGQTFLVRAFAGLDVCGFKAQVLASHMRPYPYLHLKYPNEVRAMRVRRSLRAPTNIIIAVYDREGGTLKASGRIVDLSVGGARVHSPRPLGDRGEQIYLSFKVMLDDIEEIVTTPAHVRTVTQESDEKGQAVHVTGLQFGDLRPSQRLIIMNLVYRQLYQET